MLLRTNIFRLRPTPEIERELFSICELCASLWNDLNYYRRNMLKRNSFDWDCTEILEKYKLLLDERIARQIVKKNDKTWKSFFTLKRMKEEGRLPKFFGRISPPGYWINPKTGKKKLMTIVRGRDYRIVGRYLHLFNGLKIRISGELRWQGWQGQLIIKYNEILKKWYCHQTIFVNDDAIPIPSKKQRKAFVDLGVINIITGWIEGERQAIAFSGRPILSSWWYWSKKISELQSKLYKNGLFTSKRLRRMFLKRRLQFRESINVIVHRFVKLCYKKGVDEIIVGDVTHIAERVRGRKKVNALIHNFWCFRYIMNRLRTTAENFGIKVTLVKESGTSSRCIRCGSRNVMRRGRLFRCLDCKLEAHRDVVGVINIASSYLNRKIEGVHPHPIVLRFSSVLQHKEPYISDFERFKKLIEVSS